MGGVDVRMMGHHVGGVDVREGGHCRCQFTGLVQYWDSRKGKVGQSSLVCTTYR